MASRPLPRRRLRRSAGLHALWALGLWCAPQVAAHEAITTRITWAADVSRVVHNRCAGCHRAGGTAPMPLTTYDEVRPWAKAIKHEVLTRRMPPWGAVKGFGAFRNDTSLSLPEIALISSWVEGGAPEGNRASFTPYHRHEGPTEDPAHGLQRVAVSGTLETDRELEADGASPVRAPDGWLQLTAHLPDGSVEHLLWLRGPRTSGPGDYWFLRRVRLPKGTRLICRPASAAVDLRVVAGPPAGPR